MWGELYKVISKSKRPDISHKEWENEQAVLIFYNVKCQLYEQLEEIDNSID